MTDCPCRSGRPFDSCCGPFLSGAAVAPTAEALMRSRYTAFATGVIDYLERTLVPEARPGFDRRDAAEWSRTSTWTGLEIVSTHAGGANESEGFVEFVAHFERLSFR